MVVTIYGHGGHLNWSCGLHFLYDSPPPAFHKDDPSEVSLCLVKWSLRKLSFKFNM